MRRIADGLKVTVRFLKGEWERDPAATSRFEREVEVLRRIEELGGHDNLLPYVDHGRDGDRAYLVTEWADAGTRGPQALRDGVERAESGAVESSVRRVINLRLKGASIAWTEEHAEGVLHLRAHAKSGRWNELEAAVLGIAGWRPTARQPRRVA